MTAATFYRNRCCLCLGPRGERIERKDFANGSTAFPELLISGAGNLDRLGPIGGVAHVEVEGDT